LATIGFFLPEPYLLRLQSGLTARLALDPAAELAVASAAKGRILVLRAHNFMRMKPDLAVAAADAALAALAGQQTDPWLAVDVLSSKGLALWSLGQLDEAETVAQDLITRTPPGTSSRIAALAWGSLMRPRLSHRTRSRGLRQGPVRASRPKLAGSGRCWPLRAGRLRLCCGYSTRRLSSSRQSARMGWHRSGG
jgi:hypothetical protein